jgi:hypothetical protein
MELGERDAAAEYNTFQMEKLLHRFFKFELLDEVFVAFFATNRTKLSLPGLCAFPQGRYPQDKIYSTFFHADIPYMATVFLYTKDGDDWVNLKLNNDGFWYKQIHTEAYISRHSHDRWQKLPKSYYKYFENVVASFQDTHRMCIYYNSFTKRVDIRLRSIDIKKHKNVVITFEPGYPDFEYDEQCDPLK